MQLHSSTPIFRIFDLSKAKAFYEDWLGFEKLWEHQFEPDFPIYQAVKRDGIELHLSEHHGDCCPGSALRIEVVNLSSFHEELQSRPYRYANPGIQEMPWGCLELKVTDPFGNRLIFWEDIPDAQ